MDNKVKKVYVCPFCSAELNKQAGFDGNKAEWECQYCGNTVKLSEGDDMKREFNELRSDARAVWKKAKPVVEFGTGLVLIALGTAVAAAEYFIDKMEKSEPMDDKEYENKVDPVIEDQDHNII